MVCSSTSGRSDAARALKGRHHHFVNEVLGDGLGITDRPVIILILWVSTHSIFDIGLIR